MPTSRGEASIRKWLKTKDYETDRSSICAPCLTFDHPVKDPQNTTTVIRFIFMKIHALATNYNSKAHIIKVPLNGRSLVQCTNTYTKEGNIENYPSFLVRAQLNIIVSRPFRYRLGMPRAIKILVFRVFLLSKRRASVGCRRNRVKVEFMML